MRVIGEIQHPECKISLFHWNNRYLIKLENGLLEQTFKIPEYELSGENSLHQLVSHDFVGQALERFNDMRRSLEHALESL